MEMTTCEVIASLGMARHEFLYLRRKFPGQLEPVRMIGLYLLWSPSIIPLAKELKARLLQRGPRKKLGA